MESMTRRISAKTAECEGEQADVLNSSVSRDRFTGQLDHSCDQAGPLNAATSGRAALNFVAGLSASEFSAIDAVLFHHPSARVVLLLVGVDLEAENLLAPWCLPGGVKELIRTLLLCIGSAEDRYMEDGYCVATFPMRIDLIMTLVYRAVSPMDRYGLNDERLQELLGRAGAEPNGLAFTVNAALFALQVLFGGVSMSMDMLLLNPFDSWLPAPLSLRRAAVFLERTLEPDVTPPPDVLEEEDFEKSWNPRSHTDRGDGITTVCASHVAPRSLPKGCDFGKQILQVWLGGYAQH
eukprot:s4524_g1.t1